MESFIKFVTALFKGSVGHFENKAKTSLDSWLAELTNFMSMLKENGADDPNITAFADTIKSGLTSANQLLPAATKTAKQVADEAAKTAADELAKRNAGGTHVALTDPAAGTNLPPGQKPPPTELGRGPTG